MSTIDRIYLSSPIWAQQIMVAAYGWWWYRRRYNHYFSALLSEFKLRDRWTADQFRQYQNEKLKVLFESASDSMYYREQFSKLGVNPGEINLNSLSLFPLLEKEVLRTRPKDLLTLNPIPKGTMIFKSSGTTGTPTEIYYTKQFHALELALPAARNLGWAGINHLHRRVMFGVRKVCDFNQDAPPFWRFSPIENMAYASIYHLSSRHLPEYIKFLREYKPEIVMGYPSALMTIAQYALTHADFPAPAIGIFTTSETVTKNIRQALETVWKCKVFDRYGAVEGCLFASECEYGRYHVSPEAGIIEIIDKNGNPCPPGVIGEVICTGLQNTLQPLIRYRIGDIASWAKDQVCECGHSMPILESIEGRYEDICITPDGRQVLRFDTVFKGVEAIREAQVIQKKIDHFVIRVIPTDLFDDYAKNKIYENMRLHVGAVTTSIEVVDRIPRTSSGKFKAVICEMTKEEKEKALNG